MKKILNLGLNWGVISVLVFSWWAIRPLLHSGFFPVHDSTQVVRVHQMAQALRDGQFPVRWVADLGYGFGYPLFNFYAPLPYYLGAIFNLIGLDVLWATKIMFILGILLSGLFMYLLAKEFFGKLGGSLAALFYIYAPYHAVDIYVRGAVGEFWAMAFLPLMALGFYKVFTILNATAISAGSRSTRKIKNGVFKWIVVGAVGYAAVILSHNLTAIMTAPFLIITLLVLSYLAIKIKKLFIIHYSLFIILLALGLSAFYWLPALSEMKLTNVASQIGGGADFRDHFVCLNQFWHSPWGFGGSAPGCILDGMSFQIGKLQIILAFIAVFLTVFWWRKEKTKRFTVLITTCYLLLATFLATQYSQFIWERILPMAYIQYPWRFLVFIALFTSFLAASVLVFFKNRLFRLVAFILLTFMLLFYRAKYFKPQEYLNLNAQDYTTEETIKWRTSKISDEFLPRGFLKPQDPKGIAKEKIVVLDKFAKIENLKVKSNRYTFKVSGENENLILARVAFFPGWKVFVDGKEKSFLVQRGQIFFATPKGRHQVEVVFKNTPVRIVGNFLSFLSLGLLAGGYLLWAKKS